jgi:hypothetical protein
MQVFAADVNLLGDNIDAIKKNTENIIHTGKEVDLEVNTEKTAAVSSPKCKVKS